MATNKMNWLIEKYENKACEYLIHNTNKKKGTVVMPTGAGKSGVIYEDMIWHINHAESKIIFNLSAPILKLEAQFINDFIEVINVIFKNRCDNGEFMFFVNSSADGDAYNVRYLNADVNRIHELYKFHNNPNAKFAIVASCHKSMPKFAEKVDELNEWAKIITYIDEAHLVVSESDDFRDNDMAKEAITRDSALTKLCNGEYLYALSATPDKYITKKINESCGAKEDETIIYKYAQELIAANTILCPMTRTMRVDDGSSITKEICENFLSYVKYENPNIVHKVLVTCANTDHLNMLKDSLNADGYKVFSTCSKNGAEFSEDGETIGIDEIEFINEVDNYDGDCFVLHIKQLRQGIDIKTLTDCIIKSNNYHFGDNYKRTLIQTIGRVLRPKAGERGMDISKRMKKFGYVLLCVDDSYYDEIRKALNTFLINYYGLEIKNFTKNIKHDNKENANKRGELPEWDSMEEVLDDEEVNSIIEKIEVEMRNFVEKQVLRQKRLVESLGGKFNNEVAINSVLNKFPSYHGTIDTDAAINDNDFMKTVSRIFRVCGIGE